jgi:hypothetical protein
LLEASRRVADEKEAMPPVPPPASGEHLSPELALVDAVLGEDARSTLPPGDDTIARIELLTRAHRILAARTRGSRVPRSLLAHVPERIRKARVNA